MTQTIPVCRPLIMLVEDDDDLRETLCEVLEAEGFEPLPHKHPEAALRTIEDGTIPAAIVLDFGLPGIGGAEFLNRLRRADARWSRCPVLLLTGWEDVGRLGLAVQALMTKPAELDAFVRAVRDLIAPADTRSWAS